LAANAQIAADQATKRMLAQKGINYVITPEDTIKTDVLLNKQGLSTGTLAGVSMKLQESSKFIDPNTLRAGNIVGRDIVDVYDAILDDNWWTWGSNKEAANNFLQNVNSLAATGIAVDVGSVANLLKYKDIFDVDLHNIAIMSSEEVMNKLKEAGAQDVNLEKEAENIRGLQLLLNKDVLQNPIYKSGGEALLERSRVLYDATGRRAAIMATGTINADKAIANRYNEEEKIYRVGDVKEED